MIRILYFKKISEDFRKFTTFLLIRNQNMQKNLITPTQKHAMHKYSPQKAAFFMLFLGMQIPVFFPLRHETDKKVVRRGCILATRRKSRLHRKKLQLLRSFGVNERICLTLIP